MDSFLYAFCLLIASEVFFVQKTGNCCLSGIDSLRIVPEYRRRGEQHGCSERRKWNPCPARKSERKAQVKGSRGPGRNSIVSGTQGDCLRAAPKKNQLSERILARFSAGKRRFRKWQLRGLLRLLSRGYSNLLRLWNRRIKFPYPKWLRKKEKND